MRTKRSSVFKFVASLVAGGYLLGVSAAGAATLNQSSGSREEPSKAPGASSRLLRRPAVGPNHQNDLQNFLRALGSGYCESSCCWASGCDSVSCSDTSCSATCGNSVASYTC